MITAVRALRVYLLVFVAAGPFFGLAVTAMDVVVFGDELSEALRDGLFSGLFFGLTMAAVLGTMQLVGTRGIPAGTSLSPRQELRTPVVNDPWLPDRIVQALSTLPAAGTADVPAGRYTGTTRWGWNSYGEEVVVQLTGDPARPIAVISSRPRVRMTLLDYGKGRRNVEHVARALTGAHPRA